MGLKRTVFVAAALVACATVAFAAQERPRDCKNHYILEPPCVLTGEPGATVSIGKLYSTLDGVMQAVELDVSDASLPLPLAGRRMIVRDRHGNVRSFSLAEPLYKHRPKLLIRGSAWGVMNDDPLGPYSDLEMPGYFLPIDGGELVIEGMDAVTFGPLPVDGWRALARDGTTVPAYFSWGMLDFVWTHVSEFYHAGLDHYFMTNRADEIALLTSGAISGWQPTGKGLIAAGHPISQGYFPVCRYLLLRASGYSHFFSASKDECDALAGQPGNILESASAFLVGMPVDGVCATLGSIAGGGYGVIGEPVYRLWNGKPDTNHRFVIGKAERDAMIARGWISEGEGLDGVAMCGQWFSDPPPLP